VVQRSEDDNDACSCEACEGSNDSDAAIRPWGDSVPVGEQTWRAAYGLTNLGRYGIGCSRCKRSDTARIITGGSKKPCDTEIGDDL